MNVKIVVVFMITSLVFGVIVAHFSLSDPEYHAAYPMLRNDLDMIYQQVEHDRLETKIILVNHHLLAPHLIARALAGVATKNKQTVVLISPNHFGAGDGFAITTLYPWKTSYGVLTADRKLIKQLVRAGVTIDPVPFEREHGISNIIPFIKKSVPNARIVPIMIRDTASSQDIDALAKALPPDALIIGSFDFSHEVTGTVADMQDAKSLAALETFDITAVSKLSLDSRSGLRLLMQYAALRDKRHFVLFGATNSAKILKRPDQSDVTSYIAGYFTD
ncbi:MAG: AmmeMemoRadiSam system protein B [Patescibacteria group bacterium]